MGSMARGIPFRKWLAILALASAFMPAPVAAVPFVPASDAVVLESLPEKGDPAGKVEAVRAAYRSKFRQDSVVVMPPPACVAL